MARKAALPGLKTLSDLGGPIRTDSMNQRQDKMPPGFKDKIPLGNPPLPKKKVAKVLKY